VSLVWRILLLALLLNALTVGGVQVAVHLAQQHWFDNQRSIVQQSVGNSFAELERVYSPSALRDAAVDAAVVRRLVTVQAPRDLYDDVVVTSGRPPYDGVYLNPHGAVHRDPDEFPQGVVAAGMVQARELDGGLLPVADGYCRALRKDGEVVGYLWFRPRVRAQLPTALPLWTSVFGVAASSLLFGVVLFLVVVRTVRRPLQTLGAAATAVGRGDYDAPLPTGRAVPELEPLLASFRGMAKQVRDHTQTLEQAVREAVEQTKQKERALVLSSRLASIGTLAAGVAHEINNPIGGMQNAVNRLLQAPDLSDKQRTYLQLVLDGLQRIARTARRLLDFSPRAKAPGSFPVSLPIDGARALVEHRLQRAGVQFTVDVPKDLPPVHGDAHEIQQVMLNLLLNSLDALEARGKGGAITVRAERDGDRLHVRVDDDGPGMDAKDLPRVFDPFFSKKDRPDASGLGMFICYSIVQNHGGEISVDSRPGEGFHVHIVLPLASAA
jgi:signal transduction histidine kinase